MKLLKKILLFSMLLTILFSFNVLAMNNNYNEPQLTRPETEEKHADRSLDFRWVWVEDNLCIRSKTFENYKKSHLLQKWELGSASRWSENGQSKKRDTYNGKWSQSESGIWSFVFDDYTVPIGITKIDGVLYAFSGYGELIEGYEYYPSIKTGADGLVTSDNPEFLEWLKTQYVPDCTTTKTE